MLRAILKGSGLFLFGRMPGGTKLYRELTRNWMGTQATHIDKLKRVWPGYAQVWQSLCGLKFDGLDVWIHEGGWTPFPLLINYLLTGKAGLVTNSEGRILEKYLARAVNGALDTKMPLDLIPESRRRVLEPLRWCNTTSEAISGLSGRIVGYQHGNTLKVESSSIDLCHSGGALEHYKPGQLRFFIRECHRILRPGGIASHVLDHRDHLFHADRKIHFLAHLAWPDFLYGFFVGHPLGYHCRLLPTQVISLFEEAGFKLISLRRMLLPDRRYVDNEKTATGKPGITRKSLRLRFRIASDADLCTAAGHYLFRKIG
jgi:SAM-dependent methyltransferase